MVGWLGMVFFYGVRGGLIESRDGYDGGEGRGWIFGKYGQYVASGRFWWLSKVVYGFERVGFAILVCGDYGKRRSFVSCIIHVLEYIGSAVFVWRLQKPLV